MARIALVSYRLGGYDGVAIEAAKWTDALRTLGHEVLLVAGEGTADVLVPALALDADATPTRASLAPLADADLVIVENIASLPLNPGAREALYEVLEGRRAIFHHHDFAWQRAHLAHLEGPRDHTGWLHVTINELSRRELAARGIAATTLYNSFDCDPPAGRRELTRRRLHVTDETIVLAPTRAIARKNIEGALALAARLGAVFWLLGPSEEGYEEQLRELIKEAAVPVRRGLAADLSVHDAYAASDLVVMSSTWEGFGNPVLESVTHRRPLALFEYPVAREIRSFGLRFFDLEDDSTIAAYLAEPDEEVLRANLALAREHFNRAHLPARLADLLATAGVVEAPVVLGNVAPRRPAPARGAAPRTPGGRPAALRREGLPGHDDGRHRA